MSAPDTPKDGVLYHTGYPVSAQRDSRVASVLRREENSPWGPFERPVVSSRYRLYPNSLLLEAAGFPCSVPGLGRAPLFNDRDALASANAPLSTLSLAQAPPRQARAGPGREG
jgi:hypothetical protein